MILHFIPKNKLSSKDKELEFSLLEGTFLREGKTYWSFVDINGIRRNIKKRGFYIRKSK